ncbi:VOC family protein [Xylanibacillus composti]|uniref:VOC family protein n=1 Tax=Xylanibacillus composti TaxID=1572762 RepID=A0A8J4H4H8_9BACL|nr:VOC family protein [Xylanibacillus composti]MDT9726625.1 VOC family protein [Xylanibacillus composti]GIQ70813.1 VOC family protein [Xylanibacillus composti]
MALHPYLIFDGNAREAALYYAQVFGLEEPQLLTFGSTNSEHLPPGSENLIMHTYLEIAGGKLMISDNYPGAPFQAGNNFTLAYVSGDEAAIRDAFSKLKEEGSVKMELQETPWSKCYGMVTDKYNIEWQFSHEA